MHRGFVAKEKKQRKIWPIGLAKVIKIMFCFWNAHKWANTTWIRKAWGAQDTVISPAQSANAFWSEGDRRAVSAAEESRAAHLLSPEQNMEQIQEKQSFKMSTFTYGCITLPGGRARENGHRHWLQETDRHFGSIDDDVSQRLSQELQNQSASWCKKRRRGSGGRWRRCGYFGGRTGFLSQASKVPPEAQAPFAPLPWPLPALLPRQATEEPFNPFFSFSLGKWGGGWCPPCSPPFAYPPVAGSVHCCAPCDQCRISTRRGEKTLLLALYPCQAFKPAFSSRRAAEWSLFLMYYFSIASESPG